MALYAFLWRILFEIVTVSLSLHIYIYIGDDDRGAKLLSNACGTGGQSSSLMSTTTGEAFITFRTDSETEFTDIGFRVNYVKGVNYCEFRRNGITIQCTVTCLYPSPRRPERPSLHFDRILKHSSLKSVFESIMWRVFIPVTPVTNYEKWSN